MSVGQTTHRPEPGTKSRRPAPPHTFIIDGHLLRELRRQHGLSQEELADQAGISVTTVARLERQLQAPAGAGPLAASPGPSARIPRL